jgi:transglutaminase-like putative cysteine protease
MDNAILPSMIVNREPLRDALYTGELMHQMAEKYKFDMAPHADLSVIEVFDLIKSIPFSPDPNLKELLKRPYYTLKQIGPGGDCDDKAIALAAWAILTTTPYRFLGVGRRVKGQPFFSKTRLTHVFTQLYILGDWLTADATYNFNILGANLGGYDRIEIL